MEQKRRPIFKRISREQAIAMLRSANEKGKNRGSDHLDDFSHLAPGSYILTKMPLGDLDYFSQTPEREQFYAAVPGTFPPVLAVFSARRLRNHEQHGDPLKAFVTNGNHRCCATELRGDRTISTIMSEPQYDLFQRSKTRDR
jgi:hypothetical protein